MLRIIRRIPKRVYLIFIVVFFTAMLILFAEKYMTSVTNGLRLFAVCVLPALFPFVFFSKILSELNFGQDLGLLVGKPVQKLYNAPRVSGYILMMSMLCGYPIGAKLLSDSFLKGEITAAEAKKIAAFTSTSGPLFILGTIGVTLLADKKAGAIILISHYIGTLLNGLLYRKKGGGTKETASKAGEIVLENLLDAMPSTISALLMVGGYIVIFNLISDILFDINLIGAVANALSYFGLNASIGSGLTVGLIEMTKGSLIISQTNFPLLTKIPFITFLVTFGGISVTLQSLTFLSKIKISPAYYLLTKFTQGIIASLLSLGLAALLL